MIGDCASNAGPGDKGPRNTQLEGYQPVSRSGEVAMNAFGTRPTARTCAHYQYQHQYQHQW